MKNQKNEELGTVIGLGQTLERSDLHQDPFQALSLAREHAQLLEEMQQKLKSSQEERLRLKENIIEQTKGRIRFVLGPHASEENIEYVAEPYMGLMEKYSGIVDESRVEIDGLNKVLETQNMEIAKLSKENEKYLMLTGVGQAKRTWAAYEDLLGTERIVNRKFISMMADQSKDRLVKAGRKDTYRDYLAANSNFASGEGMAPLFPRRHRSPKY